MTKKVSWDISKLEDIIADSTCWVDVVRAYGMNDRSAGNWKTFQKYALKLNIDTSHFIGRASGRGRPKKKELCEVLTIDSDFSTHHLRRRLIKEKVKEARCESCGLDKWLGAEIALELDHINGNSRDHRIENLRVLCPNCHAMTGTWRGRNKNGAKADVDEAAD